MLVLEKRQVVGTGDGGGSVRLDWLAVGVGSEDEQMVRCLDPLMVVDSVSVLVSS